MKFKDKLLISLTSKTTDGLFDYLSHRPKLKSTVTVNIIENYRQLRLNFNTYHR